MKIMAAFIYEYGKLSMIFEQKAQSQDKGHELLNG